MSWTSDVEDDPDPRDIEFLETQIRREAAAATGLGEEIELAIFVRDAGTIVAGHQRVDLGRLLRAAEPLGGAAASGVAGSGARLLAAAEAEASARGCTQTVHFTYGFQARALYVRSGYELMGRVEDFPSGTDVLWYRKHLTAREASTATRSD